MSEWVKDPSALGSSRGTAPALSPGEYDEVTRFGLHEEAGLGHSRRMRAGFVIVVGTALLIVVAIIAGVLS